MDPDFLIFVQDGEDRYKIRIPQEGITSGEALAKVILEKLLIKQSVDVVEIYDAQSNGFSLLVDELNVAKRFGTKLICSLNYSSANTSNLPIEGRHFPYQQGMMISNIFVEVHEQPNHLGAGTGLNVWDGAILL